MTPAPVSKSTRFHCPYRQATLLQQALTPNKMRVGFLLGAGCPVGIRIQNGGKSTPLIPDIAGLTKKVTETIEGSVAHKASFATILKRLSDGGKPQPNIEQILSYIRALSDVVGNGNIDGLTGSDLSQLDAEICKVTTEVVNAKLPGEATPHHQLATWIGGIQRVHPVEVFTPNYDLLMEQALEQRRVPYFDGFVGSDRTFFDLPSMEQDNLPARWARLWKVHGSINWWRTPSGNVERCVNQDQPGNRQMIYPSHLKYDESRRLPYLAMLDRLKSFFAMGQAVLVTCGYSFADEHLNEIILQGLSGNPNAICFALLYGDRAQYPEALKRARKQPNLSLLAADGAVLNTIELDWHSEEKPEHILHGIAVQKKQSSAATESNRFMLGDFVEYGSFLMQQLEHRDGNGGANDAK